MTNEVRIYTVEEAASMLGISRGTAYQLVRTNEIPHIRLGKRYLIPKVSFDHWFKTMAGNGGGLLVVSDTIIEDLVERGFYIKDGELKYNGT